MLRLEEEDLYAGIATSGGGGGGGGSSTKYGASIDNFLGDVDANGVLQAPSGQLDLVFTGVKEIPASGAQRIFYANADVVKSVSFPDLETLGSYALNQAFWSGNARTTLKTISLPKLKEIAAGQALYQAFYNQGGVETIDLLSLEEVEFGGLQYAFGMMTGLKNVYFRSLTSSGVGANGSYNNMLYGITGCTVHFPSNLQSVIGSWFNVTGGFGGTNTTVLFDLPATE